MEYYTTDFMPQNAPTIVTVGTSSVTLLNPNSRRIGWLVIFQSTGVASGNTGIIYLGVDTVPSASSSANQIHGMVAGTSFGEYANYKEDEKHVSTGTIYAIASATGQQLEVIEVTE